MKAKDWQVFQEQSLRQMKKYADSVNTDARTETSTAPQIVFRSVYWLGIVLVGAIATAIGKSSGILIAAPALPALAFFWFGKRFLGESKKPYLSLLSVLFGHSTWMLLSAALLAGVNPSFTLEAALYFAAVLWLAMKPGRVPLIVLSIYTAIALLTELAAFNTPGPFAEGLVLHMSLRVIILLMMAPLLFKVSARRQSSESVEEQPDFSGKKDGAPLDHDLTALRVEKEELLKRKAYLDLQAEVEKLREEVAQKAK